MSLHHAGETCGRERRGRLSDHATSCKNALTPYTKKDFSASQRIFKQHGNRHGPHTARNGGDVAGPAKNRIEIDIAYGLLRPVRLGEHMAMRGGCRFIMQVRRAGESGVVA